MSLRDHIPGVKKTLIGTAGRRSEKKVAKSLHAQLKPASGAMAGAKGDMATKDFLIEAKSTTNDSISIKHDWLGKISQEAMMEGRDPALSVRFTRADGRAINYGDWMMIPRELFEELMEARGGL